MRPSIAVPAALLALALAVGAGIWLSDGPGASASRSPVKEPSLPLSSVTHDTGLPVKHPVQLLPMNGEERLSIMQERIAPLEIQASSSAHSLVKLVDALDRREVMTVFIRKGMTISIDVPLGVYELRYATGDDWYGYEYLFGPTTSFSKADKLFEFRDAGDHVTGYTVTLYRVPSGNLHTSRIGADEF